MAQTGNGSSKYVKTNSAIAAPSRYSFHFHYRNATSPGFAANRRAFTVGDVSATYDVTFCWHHTVLPKTIFHRRSGGSYDSVTIPGALSVDTWYRVGGRYDGSNLAVFLNGSLSATNAAADPPATPDPTVSAGAGYAATLEFDNGTIAEVALWNVALTNAEYAALGQGVSPLLVRPQSLVLYWPLIRTVVPSVGPALQDNGPTVAAHPSVIYPDADQMLRLTANPSYHVRGSGGLGLRGAATVATQYAHTGSGGLTLGGAAVLASDASFSTSVAFAPTAEPPPEVRAGVALAGTWSLGDLFARLSQGVRLKSQFAGDSGALATNRRRGNG